MDTSPYLLRSFVFGYVCDRLIPGCSHRETGDTPEAVREKAEKHLHEHHGMEYIDGDTSSKLDNLIIEGHAR
jgi:predicted small metal-binding protein